MEPEINKPLPNLTFHLSDGKSLNLEQLKGKNVILYFYPKDSTPGCTQESKDFRDLHQKFSDLNCEIFGISRDSATSHQKFKSKHCLPFELIVDNEETLCNYFNVIKAKNMFGIKVRGIERSTFLVDKNGILRKQWRKVKVTDHAQHVLNAINEL